MLGELETKDNYIR